MSNSVGRKFDWDGANQWWRENKALIRSRQHRERMKAKKESTPVSASVDKTIN